jgi:peptidoglycan/LPS O-acetylase OafA/YrhL
MTSAAIHDALPQQQSPQVRTARFYRPELDVLRLFAFLCVFVIHAFSVSPETIPGQAFFAPVGAYGLCLFFFLSSYLITDLLCREQDAVGQIHVQAFYLRRVLRIWPLYFGFILFGKIFGHVFPFFSLGNKQLVAYSFLAGNWYLARYGGSWSPAEPLWSISLEEQFYLVWPLLARFGGRRLLLVVSACLLPVAWASLYAHSGQQPVMKSLGFGGTIWCDSFVQFQFFALGALLSLVLRNRGLRLSPAQRGAAFACGCLFWLGANQVFQAQRVQDYIPAGALIGGYSLIAAGCGAIFLSVLGISARLPQSLIYLGRISYGLYVFHWLFIELFFVSPHIQGAEYVAPQNSVAEFAAKSLLALAATVGAALLSYQYFELPFLKFKKRFTWVPSRAP